ncbi:MAG: cytidine deaminase [Prevotella sp.]|jgi:cytidine deaminase|nr:cytidine deaminase [Prevotella sp.]
MESLNLTAKIRVYTFDEGAECIKKLINEAKLAAKNAYAPYSGFRVGAAVLLCNGEIITGNNQENAAYPSGLCAERVALFAANAQRPDIAVEAIAIAGFHDGEFTGLPCRPCGGCRQVMVETENRYDKPVKVIMYGKSKIYEAGSAKDLLPLGFEKGSLPE